MLSVVSYPDRDNRFGNNNYRGNCSGRLIEDIIDQYQIKQLSDYMVGGGTTEDVCKSKNVPGTFLDLNRGFDMMSMEIPERAENVFWHPPYGQMITYSDVMYSADQIIQKYHFDPRINDLSRAKDWNDFVKKMNYCMMKQFASIEKGGRMFVLMGDWKQKGRLYSMLSDIIKPGTLEQIIIKMQHNCVSERNSYANRNFVPICHEYLMVVKKDVSLIIPVSLPKAGTIDLRDTGVTWRDLVASVLEDAGRPLKLSEIYDAIEGHKKAESNRFWKEKIRQTLQLWKGFHHVSEGVWSMAA